MIAPLLTAAVLFLGLIPHLPYGCYQILRWVVFGVSCYGAFRFKKADREFWLWSMVAMAVLFNPISPIRFSRQVWQMIDLASGIFFLATVPVFKVAAKLPPAQ